MGRLRDGACGCVEESTTGEGMVDDKIGETDDYKKEGGSGLWESLLALVLLEMEEYVVFRDKWLGKKIGKYKEICMCVLKGEEKK